MQQTSIDPPNKEGSFVYEEEKNVEKVSFRSSTCLMYA